MKQMTFRELTKMFYNFLKENNCYKEYLKNFRIQRCDTKNLIKIINPLTFIIKPNEDFDGYGIIDKSFLWSETKEGHRYWNILDYKWNNLIRVIGKIELISEELK